MTGSIKQFPGSPGYDEDITVEIKGGTIRVTWYLYDEFYPGFEDHNYIVESIPDNLFRQSFGLGSDRDVLDFFRDYFKDNISSERFCHLLDSKHIPYTIIPDDEWVPGYSAVEDEN